MRLVVLAGLALALPMLGAQDFETFVDELRRRYESDAESAEVVRSEVEALIEDLEHDVFYGREPDALLGGLASAWLLRAELSPNARIGPMLERTAAGPGLRTDRHELCARLADEIFVRAATVGDWDRAEEALETAERVCVDSREGALFRVRSRLAMLWRNEGRLAESLAILDRFEGALAGVSDEALRAFLRCEMLGRRAEALLLLGLGDQALPLIDEERELAARLQVPEFLAGSDVHRCDLYITLLRFEDAVRLAEEAASRAPGEFRPQLRLRQAAAAWELARADPERWSRPAREAFEAVVEDEQAGDGTRLLARMRLVDVLWSSGEHTRALELLERVEAAVGEREAFDTELYLAELGARVALEGGASAALLEAARERLDTALARLAESWSAMPIRSGGVAFLQFGVRRRLVGTALRLAMAVEPGEEGVRRSLELLYEIQALGSTVRSAGGPPGGLESALELLRTDAGGALVYLPGRDRTHLFLLDEGPLTHLELAPPAILQHLRGELAALAPQLAFDTRADQRERAAAFAAALSDELLPGPVRERIAGWSRLTVVGAQIFGAVPFELLPFDGVPVGERFAVDHLASLPLAVLLDRRTGPEPEGDAELCLIVAPNVAPAVRERWPHLAEIPFVEDDRRALTSGFAAERVAVHAGPRADSSSLSPSGLGGARVLHVVAHGVHDYTRERSALLVLAPGAGGTGLVGCDEVERLRAPELVVLSACGAGRGAVRRGDDRTADLGGAFLAAGARAVVISTYDLDYRVVLRVSEVFFERLREHGDSPAEALRRARVALAADDELSPWAAGLITVVGLGQQPLY